MHKSTYIFLSLLLTLYVITPQAQSALAEDSEIPVHAYIINGQMIYGEGKGAAMACGGCHGEAALGMDALEAPRLANLGQVYIRKQLDDYASDKRIDPGAGAAMNDIAKALDEQDRLDIAAYLDSLEYVIDSSDLKALADAGSNVGNIKRGENIMIKGIKRAAPACQDCHGLSGRAANIPAIHQQKYVYLVNQMQRYRDGGRTNDRSVGGIGIMRNVAKKLSNKNIADIAAYLSTVSDITP